MAVMDLDEILKALNMELLKSHQNATSNYYYIVTKKGARVTIYPHTKNQIETLLIKIISEVVSTPNYFNAELRKPHLFKQSLLIQAGLINDGEAITLKAKPAPKAKAKNKPVAKKAATEPEDKPVATKAATDKKQKVPRKQKKQKSKTSNKNKSDEKTEEKKVS
jgi:hypothetical protein